MSSSLKQEALRARKGKFKQITIKCICKGQILTNLDYIHKVDNHKVKTRSSSVRCVMLGVIVWKCYWHIVSRKM